MFECEICLKIETVVGSIRNRTGLRSGRSQPGTISGSRAPREGARDARQSPDLGGPGSRCRGTGRAVAPARGAFRAGGSALGRRGTTWRSDQDTGTSTTHPVSEARAAEREAGRCPTSTSRPAVRDVNHGERKRWAGPLRHGGHRAGDRFRGSLSKLNEGAAAPAACLRTSRGSHKCGA